MNILKFVTLSCVLLPALGLNASDTFSPQYKNKQKLYSLNQIEEEGIFSSLCKLPKSTYKLLWKKASWGRVAAEGCVLGLLGTGIAYKYNKAFKTKVNNTIEKVKNSKETKPALKAGAIFTAGVVTAVTVPSLYTKLLKWHYGEGYYAIYGDGEDNI
ncbi:hypothetical protein H0X06_03860 [Candidatus Dependentiae bacterium]|nr:hypothetical protein [Candidatus Dependentiae bacterium]